MVVSKFHDAHARTVEGGISMRAVMRHTVVQVFCTVLLGGLTACSLPVAGQGPAATATSTPPTTPQPAGCDMPTAPAQLPVAISRLTGRIVFSAGPMNADDVYVMHAD